MVQLGAYGSDQAARTAWATLVANAGDALKGQKPVYAAKGRLVRLHLGPFPERDDARDLCQKLSAGGRPCFVTKE
jgi:cell division septation protein DedD